MSVPRPTRTPFWSAARSGGVTRSVEIESLAGQALVLRTDLPRPWRVEGARAPAFTAVDAGDVRVDLRRGERIRLTTATDLTLAVDIAPPPLAPSPSVTPVGCGVTRGARDPWALLSLVLLAIGRARRQV